MDLRPPPEVRRIARRLEGAGFETWAVGGAVRDALRGEAPEDWDLTTAARPADVRRLFKRTVPIGIEHGTVGVLGKDGHLYEVTTFRRDVETFGRRARVAFADSLDEDLERRDFTINAVAWNPLSGELRDPHGGAEDLRRGVLRTVGDPAERFAEDRLRVLRALRFAGRFDLEIDEATWRDLVASADRLGNLSAERIREELYKVLGGQEPPSRTLRLYERSGVLAALYPELQACVGCKDASGRDLWEVQLSTVDAIPYHRMVLRLAGLLHLVGWPATDDPSEVEQEGVPAYAAVGGTIAWRLMRRLKASNADSDRVAHLVAQHAVIPGPDAPDVDVRRWLRRVGLDHYRDVLRLRRAITIAREGEGSEELLQAARHIRAVVRARPALSVQDLAIGGNELRAAGIPAGPLYGEILRDLLERVTEEPALNTPERLIAIVQEWQQDRE
ncbi:MAG TPA: CCA tRNA nucleotidyltransferase [Longimicrobiaceae bacterium]